jgi:hypothetical protein
MEDRRKEERIPADEIVEVRIISGINRIIPARVLNISPSGLRLRFDRPLNIGTHLSVAIWDELIFGRVQYCQPADDGFEAGVLVEYAIRASEASA